MIALHKSESERERERDSYCVNNSTYTFCNLVSVNKKHINLFVIYGFGIRYTLVFGKINVTVNE